MSQKARKTSSANQGEEMKKLVVLVAITAIFMIAGNLFGEETFVDVTGDFPLTGNIMGVNDDITPPELQVEVINITDHSATAVCTMNELCTTQMTSPQFPNQTWIHMGHLDYVEFSIDNLEPETVYQFSVVSTDLAGNPCEPVITEFLTEGLPEIQFFNPIIASRGVIIRFQTGQIQPSTTKLYIDNFNPIIHEAWSYHEIDSYKDGNILLDPSTTYSYYVEVEDPSGNIMVSDIQNFTTLAEGEVNTDYSMFETSINVHGTEREIPFTFPTQMIGVDIETDNINWNSYENSLEAIQGETSIYPTPENLGHYTHGYISQYGNLMTNYNDGTIYSVWAVQNNQLGINGSNIVYFHFWNNLPTNEIYIHSGYHLGVNIGQNLPISQYIDIEKTIMSNEAVHGDNNGNGIFDPPDIAIFGDYLCGNYQAYSLTKFNPQGELNINRGFFIFNTHGTIIDWWIMNGNGSGFGLGEPFTYEDPDFHVPITDTTVVDTTVVITTEEEANTASIFGFLNGNAWSQTLVQNPAQDWIEVYEYGSLDPVKTISNRSDFEFQIPNGLENWTVEAAYVELYLTSTNPDIPGIESKLLNNFPNPFNRSTMVSFSLAKSGNVNLEIYNVKGQKVRTLVNEHLDVGSHSVVWNGTDKNNQPIASGVYLYKMKTGEYIQTNRMIMMK